MSLLTCIRPAKSSPPAPLLPSNIKALSRELRVDLVWENGQADLGYEIRRSQNPGGPFSPLPLALTNLNVDAYSDFIGRDHGTYYYQLRTVSHGGSSQADIFSPWSETVNASPRALESDRLLGEVQEAAFRYFYNYADPNSGLARMGTDESICSTGNTGFALFNLVVGIERGFITRAQGAQRVLEILRFLSGPAERFHGAFPHLLDGTTGKAIAFDANDDGADLVETAFLMEGTLLCREYFTAPDPGENEIRGLSDALWRATDWNWFVGESKGSNYLHWHWSPSHGWSDGDRITGFNECQIAFVLVLASPTHPVPAKCYSQGWQAPGYGFSRAQFGLPIELGNYNPAPPLFWTEYSYLGLDPRQIPYHGKTYFEHFQNICRIDLAYGESKRNQFQGYGDLWGWSAGLGPDGYKVFAPGKEDNGTITPAVALASMPYAPDASRQFLMNLYTKYGKQLWGPFGFYDGFNLTRGWIGKVYLGNEVGPIAPMIENNRSGICWKTFMKAPEIQAGLKIIASIST